MSSRCRAPTRPHQGLPREAATKATPRGATWGTTSRQTRWYRRRVRATITARARAPSVGSSRISRSEQGRSRLLFARVALSIAPGRSPRARPAPSRASGSLRATPPASTRPGLPRIVSRLRERCVSPTSATDSRHEHLHAARLPTAITPRSRSRFPADPPGCVASAFACSTRHQTSDRVELRLTAALQLWLHQDPRSTPLGPRSSRRRRFRPSRSLRTPDRGILRDEPPDRSLVDRVSSSQLGL